VSSPPAINSLRVWDLHLLKRKPVPFGVTTALMLVRYLPPRRACPACIYQSQVYVTGYVFVLMFQISVDVCMFPVLPLRVKRFCSA
jgi:hypothetical protein